MRIGRFRLRRPLLYPLSYGRLTADSSMYLKRDVAQTGPDAGQLIKAWSAFAMRTYS